MRTKKQNPGLQTFVVFSCAAIATMLSGCSAFDSLSNKSVPVIKDTNPSAGKYQVQMTGNFQKQTAYEGTIKGSMTVQNALEQSGAISKFRNMEITVYRVVKETGRGLKMPIRFDPRKKAVPPEQDYAILPGDRIVVEAVSSNVLDKVVKTIGIQ